MRPHDCPGPSCCSLLVLRSSNEHTVMVGAGDARVKDSCSLFCRRLAALRHGVDSMPLAAFRHGVALMPFAKKSGLG
jgi:hypothetical protein